MDEQLPWTMFDFMHLGLACIATLFLATILLPIVLISTPFIAFVFWHVSKQYLQTSRQLKREEAITRSPIYSTIPTTLEGLCTIRAFGAESRFVENLVNLQNENTKISILYLALGRWLGMRLDLVAAVFNIVVSFSTIAMTRFGGFQLSGASVGLVLTYSLNLVNAAQWAFRQSAETENLMTSAERVLEYTRIPSEPQPLSPTTPPPSWPSNGEINIENLSLKYPPSEKNVLKNLTVKIPAGSTVGIVGRTGSGKSSLLQALFRLVSPSQGRVTIDGIDASQLELKTLRSRMSIIPQEPFCFRGTFRFNLDPTESHTDAELWNALTSVQLKELVESMPGKLDAFISEMGGSLSVGERQLVCLARAILRRSKIFVMDEATSAVDLNTDSLVAKVLRERGGVFYGVTTLTIAHRLNTIIDYDYVMVLDDGNLVEYGVPAELLRKSITDSDAYFSRLVNETGPEGREVLVKMAQDAAKSRQ
ncbi:UNVERIFIED_CONTAM: hypothetical protein HDU68_004744 [Siphonaria sp. JEL0065]|nr:hypothetical protein HDU68_004744 [Siphonaria sp. JEL0065]